MTVVVVEGILPPLLWIDGIDKLMVAYGVLWCVLWCFMGVIRSSYGVLGSGISQI